MIMRAALVLALAAGVATAPFPAQATDLAPQQPPLQDAPGSDDTRLLIAGLGAIAGVVAFNLAVGGTGALPFLYEAGAAGGGATASGAVAASRVYAVSTAVVGALAADYAFRRTSPPPQDQSLISRSLTERVAPR